MADSWGVKTDRLAGKNHYVRKIDNGDWIKIREVDFGTNGPASVTIQTLNFKNPGTVEFYLDAMGNNPFVKVEVDGKESVQTEESRADVPSPASTMSISSSVVATRTLRLRLVEDESEVIYSPLLTY